MKKGEIIKLGNHRLACGNCHDAELVEKLLGKDKVRIICTDPPYGVNYVESKKDFFKKGGSKINVEKDVANDDIVGENYIEFTTKWLEPITDKLESYNTFYIFNGDVNLKEMMIAMDDLNFKRSQMIIWVKNHGVVGRKDYMPQHELIVYGWYGRHKFERSKGKSVLFHPKPNKSKLHPTMKPVGLLRKLILNSTKAREYVYDPFGGSGSTLIACENTARKCLMIELDEAYCDIIIKRWELLTKKETKKC